MRRARAPALPLVLAALHACSGHTAPPVPAPKPASTEVIVPPFSSASASAVAGPPPAPPPCPEKRKLIGGPWVTFDAPDFEKDSGPAGGPPWSFDTPQIPAISADGARILVWTAENSLGASPNVKLVARRVSDRAVVSTTSLLDEAAFARVYRADLDLEGKKRAYAALRTKVAEHVLRVNEALTKEAWSPLAACRVDIDVGATEPLCSMKDQQIQCGGAVRLGYGEPDLDISVRGKKSRLRQQRWAVRAESVPGNKEAKYPVRGCVGEAYFDPARGVVLLRLVYECQGGGDGCSVPDAWQVVRLPAAPGPEPKQKNAGGECPSGMTAIPAGSFTLGSADGPLDEQPPKASKLEAFCLDTTEVTVAAYRACLKSGRCFSPAPSRWIGPGSWSSAADDGCNFDAPGRDGHPMNCVPWSFAEEYCSFMGKRLPREAEWEYAARGTEGRKHPWGGAAPGAGTCWNAPRGGTCAAGGSAADRNPVGVLDLAGNVSEWTASPHASYDGCWAESGFAVRGGSWETTSAADLRGAKRRSWPRHAHRPELGFRCAKDR